MPDLTPLGEYGVAVFAMATLGYVIFQLFRAWQSATDVVRQNTVALTELVTLIRSQGTLLQNVSADLQNLKLAESFKRGVEEAQRLLEDKRHG